MRLITLNNLEQNIRHGYWKSLHVVDLVSLFTGALFFVCLFANCELIVCTKSSQTVMTPSVPVFKSPILGKGQCCHQIELISILIIKVILSILIFSVF